MSATSSRYSLRPVVEPEAPESANRLGGLLAQSPGWIGPFIVLLDGLDFERTPSMTPGALFFEGATQRDLRGRSIIEALDDIYRDVRDGEEAARVHGHILERFVRYSLHGGGFNDALGACELHCDGSQHSSFRLDAGTRPDPPCAGIEAKTSTRALRKRGKADRARAIQKAQWVTSLLDTTGAEVAGVWATWVPEIRFRAALETLIGEMAAERAIIVGHEQLRQLSGRLRRLAAAQRAAVRASEAPTSAED